MESITTNKTNNNKELTSMETKEYYRINNWQELQKGQLPNERTPFIKVHTNLLISKPWFDLDDTSRLIFIELQLLGSEYMGYLPDDETIAFRIRRPLPQVKEALEKLSEHYICIVEEEGYKKHLQLFKERLEEISDKRREAGRKGGLVKSSETKTKESPKTTWNEAVSIIREEEKDNRPLSMAEVSEALDSFEAEREEDF